VLSARDGGVQKITLNRPQAFNSFNREMHLALRDALAHAAGDSDVRAVLLDAAGKAFCAGQDLYEPSISPVGQTPDLGTAIEDFYNPLIRQIRALPLPVVCAVGGVAAGAGANLALACDIVLAGASARFIQAFCKIGLVPDSGGTFMLPRLVGAARAAGMALLGEPVSGREAADWGLIWRCVEDDALADEAARLAAHLATQPTLGLAATKQALATSWRNTLDEQLDLERDLQRAMGRTEDYREGVVAFGEKRKPVFTGR